VIATTVRRVRRPVLSIIVAAGLLSVAPLAHADDERADGDSDTAPQNVVQVVNTQDKQLRFDGNVQLNEIPRTPARPLNEA